MKNVLTFFKPTKKIFLATIFLFIFLCISYVVYAFIGQFVFRIYQPAQFDIYNRTSFFYLAINSFRWITSIILYFLGTFILVAIFRDFSFANLNFKIITFFTFITWFIGGAILNFSDFLTNIFSSTLTNYGYIPNPIVFLIMLIEIYIFISFFSYFQSRLTWNQ